MVESDSLIGESVASRVAPSYPHHADAGAQRDAPPRGRAAASPHRRVRRRCAGYQHRGRQGEGRRPAVRRRGTPNGIWIADYAETGSSLIDPATGVVVGEVAGVRHTCEITYARGAVWAPSRTGVLYRVDPVARKITARVKVGGELDDVLVSAELRLGRVRRSGRSVIRVNPRTESRRAPDCVARAGVEAADRGSPRRAAPSGQGRRRAPPSSASTRAPTAPSP